MLLEDWWVLFRTWKGNSDSVVIVMGDFIGCTLDDALPGYSQLGGFPSGNNKILDLCYFRVTDAYCVHQIPPQGAQITADCNCFQRRQKSMEKSAEKHRACFDRTDWDTFFYASEGLNEITKAISTYTAYCEMSASPSKTSNAIQTTNPE